MKKKRKATPIMTIRRNTDARAFPVKWQINGSPLAPVTAGELMVGSAYEIIYSSSEGYVLRATTK